MLFASVSGSSNKLCKEWNVLDVVSKLIEHTAVWRRTTDVGGAGNWPPPPPPPGPTTTGIEN